MTLFPGWYLQCLSNNPGWATSLSHRKSLVRVLNSTSLRCCHESPLLPKSPINTNKRDRMFGHSIFWVTHLQLFPSLLTLPRFSNSKEDFSLRHFSKAWESDALQRQTGATTCNCLQRRQADSGTECIQGNKSLESGLCSHKVGLLCEIQHATCLSIGSCCYTEVRLALSWLLWLLELGVMGCQSMAMDRNQSSFLATDVPVLWT